MNNKLTADKARERIQHLTAWRDQRGLTLREEEYLEAMQMALMVLNAEPAAVISDDERTGVCMTFGGHDQCLPEGTLLYPLEGKP